MNEAFLLKMKQRIFTIFLYKAFLFSDCPEFYASYKLINIKNHRKYSDNLTLNVLDLSHIELATEEDKLYHIHKWAMLFKATTWEEIKMIAEQNEYLQEASKTMFRMSADELIRKRCRDREEYYQDLRNYERVIAEKDRQYEQVVAEKDRQYKQALAEIERLRAEVECLRKS